jgi:hypothetical protein
LTITVQRGCCLHRKSGPRLAGRIVLAAMPQSDGVAAEACLLRSLNQARSQADLIWELRTAINLAKLYIIKLYA